MVTQGKDKLGNDYKGILTKQKLSPSNLKEIYNYGCESLFIKNHLVKRGGKSNKYK